MKKLTESGKRRKESLNIVMGITIFCVLVLMFNFSVTAQREAIDGWKTYCDEKHGYNNWTIRDATLKERCNFSTRTIPLQPLGQINVCVAKET